MLSIRSEWATKFKEVISLLHKDKQEALDKMKPTRKHRNFSEYNDVVLDKIVEINKIDVKKYPKVYDMTVPSTLNFGLANGLHVVDTASSGYIQRKLVKSMEDVSVKYDCTVRNANDDIMQFSYGDSGIDTVKQFSHTLKTIIMIGRFCSTAVLSSPKHINRPPSPVKQITFLSELLMLAAIAAGRA